MEFNPSKCVAVTFTKKTKPLYTPDASHAVSHLLGRPILECTLTVNFLGIPISTLHLECASPVTCMGQPGQT